MVSRKRIHFGSNVARPNKVRAAHLPLRMTVKSQLGRKEEVFIAKWNVRTLMDKVTSSKPERQTALIAKELSRYRVDIAALSKTRLACYDSLVDCGYTFFWSGKTEKERTESGVGFAIKNTMVHLLEQDPSPVSNKIMTMRLLLERNAYATIISVYTPTMTNAEENKEGFYSKLKKSFLRFPKKISASLQVTSMLELDVNKINGKALLGHMGRESASLMRSCYWRCAQSTD